MSAPLMPKATAIWLLDNTALTFEQIADFCHLHLLEVQAIADVEIVAGMVPFDPVVNALLTYEEIERCTKDPSARLKRLERKEYVPLKKPKGGRYTPVSKRQDKPNAIAWILKNHPEITDPEICRLLGTTKPTIQAIRDRSHWNIKNIQAVSPMDLSLCTHKEFEKVLKKHAPKDEK